MHENAAGPEVCVVYRSRPTQPLKAWVLVQVIDRYQPETCGFVQGGMQELDALPGGLKMLNSGWIKLSTCKR